MQTNRGSPRPSWEDRYVNGDLPWDTGEPDDHLIEVVRRLPIPAGRALEIGCGTGTDALWLGGEGFSVVGIDLSASAIDKARAKSNGADIDISFQQLDFLHDELPAGMFDFIFDRGCFHVFDDPEDRAEYARRVARMLGSDGVWLSISGSTEGPERDHGPPRRSARDLTDAIEPYLEILELDTIPFRANTPSPARGWRCLAGARTVPAQPSTQRG